jgi:hypothetical protein
MNYAARFQIVQDKHIPGVPGEIVAEGVRFSDGTVALKVLSNQMIRCYADMPQLYRTHFDPVSMALHWIDAPPPGTPTINDARLDDGAQESTAGQGDQG